MERRRERPCVLRTVESEALFGISRYADADLSRIAVSGVRDIRLDE